MKLHKINDDFEGTKDSETALKNTFKKRFITYCAINTIILFYAALSLTVGIFLDFSVCPLNTVFGIPCPGCGMSRALFYAITLDFKKAFSMHPLFILVPVVFLIHSYLYLFKNKNFLLNKTVFCILAAILMTTYAVRMIIFFPNTDPLVFNEKSLLGMFIKIFNK